MGFQGLTIFRKLINILLQKIFVCNFFPYFDQNYTTEQIKRLREKLNINLQDVNGKLRLGNNKIILVA